MTATDLQPETPDADLLEAAQAEPGSEAARRAACQLLSRHRDRVYAWCYARLGDPEKALDVAQEVLLSAYRRLSTFERRSQFSSWLYVIARNRCCSEMRRPQLLVDEETDPEHLKGAAKDPASIYIESRSEEEVLALIRTDLDPLEQKVIWLRCFERMSIARITEVLEITEASGARGVLQRARRHLRAALRRRELITETSS